MDGKLKAGLMKVAAHWMREDLDRLDCEDEERTVPLSLVSLCRHYPIDAETLQDWGWIVNPWCDACLIHLLSVPHNMDGDAAILLHPANSFAGDDPLTWTQLVEREFYLAGLLRPWQIPAFRWWQVNSADQLLEAEHKRLLRSVPL